MRTSGGLVLLPGGNGQMSASQRRIAQLEAAQQHYLAVIASLVAQMGGAAIVTREHMDTIWKLGYKQDPDTGAMLYTSGPMPKADDPLVPDGAPAPEETPT